MEDHQNIAVIVAVIGAFIACGGLIVSITSLRRSSSTRAQAQRLQEKQEELIELQLKLHRIEVNNVENLGSTVVEKRPLMFV